MNKEQIKELLNACFHEFCATAGDSPCGCDACPYSWYNTDGNGDGCYEEYIRDKLGRVKEDGNELDTGV